MVCSGAVGAPIKASKSKQFDAKKLTALKAELDSACKKLKGRAGYHLRLLNSGQEIGFKETEVFPAASTIKTAVMVEAIRRIDAGTLKWTDKMAIPTDPSKRESSMWSFFMKENLKLDLDAWVNLMITYSDNTATITTRDWLGTMNVNATMEALGLKNTKILGNAPESATSVRRYRRQFGMGMTTPAEMNQLMYLIYSQKAASKDGCDKMIRILSHQYWDDFIGATVPPGTMVASKSGAINRSRSEAAIVYSSDQPYIITIYTDSQTDKRWTGENEGDLLIRKIGSRVWNTLHPNRPYQISKNYLERFSPTGGGVE